jgi:hypothetical protein
MSEDRVLEFGERHPAAPVASAGRDDRSSVGQQHRSSTLATQTHRAADVLTTTADGIVGAAQELRHQADRWAARADDLADGLYRAADRLRSSSAGAAAMADDVLRTARRHPGMVLGGAILVGLGAAVVMAGPSPRRDRTA